MKIKLLMACKKAKVNENMDNLLLINKSQGKVREFLTS